MFDSVKRWAAPREAEALGKQLAKEKNPMLERLKRNKLATGILGWIVTGVVAWAAQGCAPVYDQDVLAVLHVTCGTVVFVMGMASTFLIGAGAMTSDKHEAVKQGFLAPAGPPLIPPPAEVKRLEDEAAKG